MAPTTPTDRLLTKQIGWTPKKVSNTDEFRPPRRFYLMRSAFVTTRKPGKQHDSINRQEDRCDRREPRGGTARCGSGYRERGARARGGATRGGASTTSSRGSGRRGFITLCNG